MLQQSAISLVLLICAISAQNEGTRFKVLYEWNYVNYTWPSPEVFATAIKTSQFIPENNHISGVKYFEDYLYITVPRMKEGVPATLTRIPYPSGNTSNYNTSPNLEPYPSWEMNREGDCNALQNVQNVEIDTSGLLWIIDGGKTGTFTRAPNAKCQPRLVIYDIKQNRLVSTYTFPQDIIRNGSFLYDLVLDDTDGGYAYITDNSGLYPGIIVYSMRENRAWAIRDPKSMTAEPDAVHFTVNGTGVSASINIAGIALGPRMSPRNGHDTITQDRTVYYCALSSYTLYSISSAVLRDERFATNDIESHVKELGKKSSQTDGMVMDENGVLYYGLLGLNSIGKWDSNTPFTSEQKVIARDKTYIQWPDSLTFDMSGNLVVVTNRLQKFLFGRLNLTEPNFRVLQGYVGAKSYLYSGLHTKYEQPTTLSTSTSMRPEISTANLPNNENSRVHVSPEHDHMHDHGHDHETESPRHINDNSRPNSATQFRFNNLLIGFAIVLLINFSPF